MNSISNNRHEYATHNSYCCRPSMTNSTTKNATQNKGVRTVLLVSGALAGGTVIAFASFPNASGSRVDKSASWQAMDAIAEIPETRRVAVTVDRLFNQEAPIPPQCYTKTDGTHNPCYTCHQSYDRDDERLNRVNDGGLQGEYQFSDVGIENHWSNLFVDRTEWIASISDEVISAYVAEDNYSSLRETLKKSGFSGYLPDLENFQNARQAFDERGLALDGSNWVAYNYKPFPGTFWPTNGSTDDVIIRLPSAFREVGGEFSRDVYYVNLSLVEINLKDLPETTLWPIDERKLGVDLDRDGKFMKATRILARDHYVGDARSIVIETQQFPTGTEFLHSVRYVGVDEGGQIHVPRRMKELRYMRKVNTLSRQKLESRYANERKEKRLGEVPNYVRRGDEGFDNAYGWYLSGFIEDYEGELRPQTFEEQMFCMGCHSAVGTTLDSTFSFARKVPGASGWRYIDLVGMKDAPSRGEPNEGEILAYLRRAGGGSEFRENSEMRQRWFKDDGSVDEEKVRDADVYTLVAPSPRRARDMNKAYLHIVRHQSYRLGRDATWTPARNVLKVVDENVAPLNDKARLLGWDIRLAWDRP